MTAEKFHDAIGLLPSDLIAEADKKRCTKPKVIPWTRYTAMAACFALVLGCSLFAMQVFSPKGATESMMEAAAEAPAAAAPMEAPAAEAAAPEEAPKEMTGNGSPAEDSACALPTVPEPEEGTRNTADSIRCNRYNTPSNPNSSVNSSSVPYTVLICSRSELEAYLEDYSWRYDFYNLTKNISAYNDAWFEDHDLLILVVHAAHTGTPWTVTAIEDVRGKDPMGWDWFVHFSNHGNEYPDHGLTNFHLLTELEKGLISPEDSILTIADVPVEPTCALPAEPGK